MFFPAGQTCLTLQPRLTLPFERGVRLR